MCTLTFAPTESGYLLAMNRDDLYERASRLPLVTKPHAIFPQENSGGTWIGVNEHGIGFALLNWSVPHTSQKQQSRGLVIPAMLAATSDTAAEQAFSQLMLQGTLPFRLIGVFPDSKAIHEWRWDGVRKDSVDVPRWALHHWFSSGLSDEQALSLRAPLCQAAAGEPDCGTVPWLRRLHATHNPASAPFSICVHRERGGTLSYTEIEVEERSVSLRYSPQAPCSGIAFSDQATLVRQQAATSSLRA